MRRAILTALVLANLTAWSMAAAAPLQAAQGRPVTLRQAAIPPTYLRMLQPGRSTTVTRQCGSQYWSELSAYQWNGEALPGQRYYGERMHWGRVTFDGITWRNGTSQPVLVAGWCD